MNTVLRIYAYSLGFYALFTVPAIAEPFIYVTALIIGLLSSVISFAFFAVVFFLLHLAKPRVMLVIGLLAFAIALSVFGPFIIFFADGTTNIFDVFDIFSLFPLAAVLAGWVSLAINYHRIKEHFVPELERDIETLFS